MDWRLGLELVSKFFLLASLFVGGFLLYVFLEDVPFGVQTATAIAYTAAVFCFVFFRWKGLPHSFSLRNKRVQRQIPCLLAIHGAFLTFVLTVLTAAIGLKSHMPSYWLTESGPKHRSLFITVSVWVFTLTFFTQVLISRSILRRNRRGQTSVK